MDVFKNLSTRMGTIKRWAAILCGDEAGGATTWQGYAELMAEEMRMYATLLHQIADGKHGGGIVFPSWDEGVDGGLWQRLEDCETRLSVARETIRAMLHALESCRAYIEQGPVLTDKGVAACVYTAAAIASGKRAMGST